MLLSNPFVNDPRVYNEAQSLTRGGHYVFVLGCDRSRQYEKVSRWDGIDVERASPCLNTFKPLSLASVIPPFFLHARTLVKSGRFDVVHCHDLDTFLVGVCLKRIFHLPLIYDMHEVYGYMVAEDYPCLEFPFMWLERQVINKADYIISAHYHVPATKRPVTFVLNCKTPEYQERFNDKCLQVSYLGLLSETRGVTTLVQSVSALSGVYCMIAGAGPVKYVNSVRRVVEGTGNSCYLGVLPLSEAVRWAKNSDVIYTAIDPKNKNNAIGMGNKLFEAMAYGKPVIGARGTAVGDFIEKHKIGLVCTYGSRDSLVECLLRLRDDIQLRQELGHNGFEMAKREYNWQNQEKRLLEVYGMLSMEIKRGK